MGSVTKAESLAVTKIDSQTSEEISDCRDINKHKVQGLHLLQRQGFFVSRNLLNSIMTTDQRTQNLNGDILQKSVNRFIEGYEKPRVKINNKGFSVNNITVMEGQIVNIEWENNSARLNLIQLIHDGDKLRPVIGGYSRDMPQSGKCEQQFNLEGEYKFAIGSVRCTPLTVNVRPRMDLQAEVTDEGFKPSVIVIDKGHSLKWHWKQCNALHSVHELAFCMRHGGFLLKSPNSGSVIGTVSGAYRHEFHQPGLYYFRTGSSDLGKTHLCIVCVRDILREHKIEVLDKAFQPMILLVTVGDKVWWHWDKFKCKRLHSVYQIEAPTINHPSNQPFEVKKDGFIWPSPSKQGLMSHEFHEPGVYLYSDRNSQECADYIGTIIVKPKRQEHMVEVTQKGFMTDLLHASTGDRIWWTWNAENLDSQKLFSICELEKSLTTTSSDVMCNDNCEPPEHEAAMLMKNLGLATACMTTTGVHHYSISSGVEKGNICSVIVNPSIKNHTIHVTDNGFEPKVITIQPNDQVWWIWQSGNKQHNVMQVSHECHLVTDGFCSGAITDCPSAFMHQFSDASGVFYFMNASLPNIFGAITVSSQPKVHEVQVTIAEVKPDPVMVHVNDVVCWIFKGPRQNDMCEVESIEALTTSNISGSLVPARICMARRIDRTGLFHFSSKSLQRRKTGSKGEIRLSSVIADEMSDYDAIIKVDSNGFHPSSLTIRKNQSVLWTWKGSDGSEGHNIIHVNSPDSNHPLSLVTGVQSFNSGKPIVEGTFQHTFYEMGNFSVVSQGAPGFSCSIHVLRDALRTDTPIISSKMDGGIIDVHSKVTLACNTAGAKIYFTVNSSMPQQHCGSTKLYDPKKGIILKNPGLCFLRAMASCEGRLSSQLFTSRRFWVVAEENDDDKQSVISTTEEIIPEKADSTEAWEWWKCVPEIKTLCISPGVIEVVWELPNKEPANLVKGYQVFLNGISYSAMFPPFTSSVQITGLAGGQEYDTYVQVYAKSNKFSPQQSNKVMILCPITSPEGGPLISLERTEQPDSLAVVWMAIKDIPIAGYWLYLNGQKCGKKVVPNAKSNRCKVVIEGCKLEKLFRFYVVAVPLVPSDVIFEEGTEPKISNIMEVTLPLDSSDICLPPPEERFDEEDIYKEYLEVTEGSGYLPDTTEIVSADVHNEDIQRAPYTKGKRLISYLKGDKLSVRNNLVMSINSGPLNRKSKRNKATDEDYQNSHVASSQRSSCRLAFQMPEYDQKFKTACAQQRNKESSEDCYSDMSLQTAISQPPHSNKLLSFKRVAKIIMEFVSQESLLHHAVAPGRSESYFINWKKLQNYYKMASAIINVESSTQVFKFTAPKEVALKNFQKHQVTKDRSKIGMQNVHEEHQCVEDDGQIRQSLKTLLRYASLLQQKPCISSLSSFVEPNDEDAAIIVDDNKLHSTKEKNEDLLTDSHGSCNLAKIKTINLIKATPGKDESNESDTRTDSSLINSPLPSHSSVVVIDATKAYSENRTRVHSAKTYQSEILKENSFQGMVADIADLDLDRSKLKSSCVNKIKIDAIKKSSKRKSRTAIIELKNVADINATQHMEEPVSAEERFISADERTIGSITETNMKPFHVQDSEFFVTDGDGFLPSPSIMVEGLGINDVVVNWELQQPADPKYKVMFFVVSIIGTQFLSDINSNISFECNMMNEKNQQVRGVQHCWNVSNKSHRSCKIHGLIAGHTYRIHLVANYVQCHGDYPCEIQTSSALIHYTTKGPPKPPVINPLKVDLFQVSLELKPATQIHKDVQIKGYMIYIDGACIGGLHSRNIQQVVINNLIPGRTVHVSVVTIAKQAVGESIHSQPIHITCPHRPPAPQISQQPSYKKGCVLVAWERPPNITVTTNDEDISLYSIYLDDKWQGEIQANHYCDKHGYQFFLNDLTPGQNFDVYVKTVCGPKNVDPNAHHIYCLSESVPSIVVSVTVPAPPNSPKLRLEGLSPSGLDITWQTPQQYGDAAVSGYQMLKNGKLYGSVIPPEVNMLRIKDITLGEKVTLQLIALTEHPVGKTPALTNNDRDSGIEGSNPYEEKKNLLNDRYAGCKPGARLVVHFTGLVQPPSKVWCEKVTGHSALIVWSKDDHPKSHFVKPENYQVTWWPGNRAEEDIGSDSTSDDHLLLNNLQPSVTYTVVVEARKLQKYKNLDEDEMITDELDGMNAFILTSRSEQIKVMTASPPEPPSNLGMIATTCNSLRLAWHPPREHGVEVLSLRVECISLNNDNKHESQVLNLMPDTTEAIVGNLAEKTEHLIRVIAITDEYFEKLMHQHKMKQTRIIPPNVLVGSEQSKWLPNSSLIIKTSGTDPPTNLQVMKSTSTSLLLSWSSPVVYGSNKLMGAIVRWADTKTVQKSNDDDTIIARHISLPPHEDSFTIENLCPGSQYRIVVEAVVSLKTSLEPDRQDFGIEKDRRTVHIPSVPLFTRTRAPITLSPILVRSYRNDSVSLYWEKPLLTSVIGKDEMGKPLYLRRHLVGYKLEVNGVLQCTLKSQAKNCILTKCKPGKTYSIVLVALTCTDNMRKERKRMQKDAFTVSSSSDLDPSHLAGQGGGLDYSLSDPVEVCLPRKQEGSLVSLCTTYNQSEKNEGSTFGDIFVEWSTSLEKASTMKQFSVIWFCLDEKTVQTKYVGPDIHQCHLPVTRLKSVYEISVEPNFYGDIVAQTPQPVQVMIPGPPDAPEIFLKSVSGEEIIVEWGEPRMYSGVNIKGYQVYVNDKKVGTVLKSSHKRCVIPRHPNKQYKINLVTLGGNVIYGDSARSNSLVVDMAHGFVTKIGSVAQTEDNYLIPLKVVLVTDISIHLDWTSYLESEDIESFRIQWSSVAQPAQREVNLSPKDVNYVINKCLPRTTHFVRLIAFGQNGQIIDRSRQLTVQTSAPPDSPILSVRACNFHYITLQWEKPQTYGEALITGYKVYLDGVVETSLSADHHCFTFTSGQWCQEYLFQVQALTASEHLCSKPSEPLLIAWPGLRAPAVHCASLMGASSLQVTWDDPLVTEGVKVKHFRLQCVDRETEKTVESVGPIHPDSRQAEFKHLRRGNLFVFLEIHIYGTNDIVRSDQVQIQLAPAPDPPCIDARVIGLEERRQLQKMTCDLLNTRERLIRMLGNRLTIIQTLPDLHMEKNQAVVQAVHSFSQTEELLDKCLSALTQYTGQLLVHVSWFCQQSNPDMRVTAYRLLIDGKQYGGEIHAEHSSVRVKLKLDQPVHRLTMVALNNDQQATSDESNVLELLTEPFQPFSSYCYHNVHTELARWPNYGCCQYQDSIVYERKRVRKLANQGLLHKQVPMPACYLLDLFEGDYRPILLPHSSQAPHVILFWTSWCLSSKKTMNMLMRFAKENKELNYLAISCDSSSKDRQSLAHLIKQNGWQADRLIHHCSSLCSFPNNLERKKSERNSSKKHCETTALDDKADVSDILGIAGVPTFLFVTDGNISWHGRYCAIDYQTFSAFVSHTISEITDETCSVLNCSLCRQNASGEDISEIIDKIHAYTVQLGIITGRKENSLLDSTFTNAEGDTILIAAPKWQKHKIFDEDKHGRQSPRILHKRKSSPDSVKLKQLNHEQETPNELSSTLPIQKISRPKTSYRAARIHKQAKNKRTAFISL